jgi:hypothetical protein
MGTEHGFSWLDFMDHIPDRATNAFRGPSWGVGEMMDYEVLELIYQTVKEAKSQGMIVRL